MAQPVVVSFDINPSVIAPGGTAVVAMVISDPDNISGTLTASYMDSQGNSISVSGDLEVADPGSFELVDTDGVGFNVVPRLGEPGVWDVTAP